MDRTRSTLAWIAHEGQIPSLSVHVLVDGSEALHQTIGLARLEPRRPARPDEAYDLASVTKVVGTLPLVARLMDAGTLDLDAPVREALPDVDPRITARHLLSHSSGYPAWAPLYQGVDDWGSPTARQQILDAARTTPLAAEPGSAHTYSDLGYLVLCALLEALGGDRLDRQLGPILADLGRDDLRWGWPGAAATEDCPLRGRVLEGEVHDQNCSAMGGVSTHAGLFGTARAVAGLGETLRAAWTGTSDALPGEALRTLVAHRGPGSHRLGFDGISAGYTSTGSHFPADTVGHLGYTGTSLWIVPSRRTVVAVLTNRIHPTDDLTAIKAARPRIHDAIALDLGWTTDG